MSLHAEIIRLSQCEIALSLCVQAIPKQLCEPTACVLVVQVIETLSTSSHIEPWAARAAGLVFAQYFWFRHCFLLTTQQGEAVQQLVVSMLSDKKLEVQDLAAASLSGGLIPMLLPASLTGISVVIMTMVWNHIIPIIRSISIISPVAVTVTIIVCLCYDCFRVVCVNYSKAFSYEHSIVDILFSCKHSIVQHMWTVAHI